MPCSDVVPNSTTVGPGATTQAECSTCTYGYKPVGSTCTLICSSNTNSTILNQQSTADCDKCAIGYYYTDTNSNGRLDYATETCTLCPNNLGYGTGTLSSCSTMCKTNEW